MKEEREIINLVRSIMYGSSNGNNNAFYDEVFALAEALAEYDGVKSKPQKNRLVLMLQELRNNHIGIEAYRRIEHINDD